MTALPLSPSALRAPTWWLALTLKQPFASLVIEGWKDVENRPWGPTALGEDGAWFLVHAGAAWWGDTDALDLGPWFRRNLGGPPDRKDVVRWPRSALLGWAYVQAVTGPLSLGANPWAWGPKCWQIPHVLRFPAPIPCSGERGLWPVEAAPHLTEREKADRVALQAAVRATGILPPSEQAA